MGDKKSKTLRLGLRVRITVGVAKLSKRGFNREIFFICMLTVNSKDDEILLPVLRLLNLLSRYGR